MHGVPHSEPRGQTHNAVFPPASYGNHNSLLGLLKLILVYVS